jgi:hypothetical protein
MLDTPSIALKIGGLLRACSQKLGPTPKTFARVEADTEDRRGPLPTASQELKADTEDLPKS